MSGIKIPQQDFALKMQGGRGLMCEGGAYLQDTMVYTVSPIEKCAIIYKLHTFWGSNCTLFQKNQKRARFKSDESHHSL